MKKLPTIILIFAVSSVSFPVQIIVNLFIVYPYIFPAVIFSGAVAFAVSCFYKMFRGRVGRGALLSCHGNGDIYSGSAAAACRLAHSARYLY